MPLCTIEDRSTAGAERWMCTSSHRYVRKKEFPKLRQFCWLQLFVVPIFSPFALLELETKVPDQLAWCDMVSLDIII